MRKRFESFPNEVNIHYNPDDPAESFIIQTPKRMLYIVIGVSCLVILFAGLLLRA